MDATIEKYYLTKQKIRELEEKLNKYKNTIENHMKNEGVKKIQTNDYIVKKIQTKNERVNKKSCPSEIWEKYNISTTYTSIDIQKINENKNIKKSI